MASDEESLRLPSNISVLPNLYDVLGVPRNATAADIRRARNRQALQHHSDRNADNAKTDQMSHINLAYDILTNPKARANYDAKMTENGDELGPVEIAGALSQGRQRSEAYKRSLLAWRMAWPLKSRKPKYQFVFSQKFANVFQELLSELPQIPEMTTAKKPTGGTEKQTAIATKQLNDDLIAEKISNYEADRMDIGELINKLRSLKRLAPQDMELTKLLEKSLTLMESMAENSQLMNQIRQICTGGYLGEAWKLLIDTGEAEDPLIEAIVKSLDANAFEGTLSQRNRPIFKLLKGFTFLRKSASCDTGPSSNLFRGLREVEESFWQGWVDLDDQQLGKILIETVIDVKTYGHCDRLTVLKQMIIQPTKEYPFFDGVDLSPPKPNPNWSNLHLRSRDLLAIRKFEKAVHDNFYLRKSWSAVEVALGYADLLELCGSRIELITCLLNASLWLLTSLEEENLEQADIFARIKLLLTFSRSAIATAFAITVLPPIKFYTARLCGLIARKAGEISQFAKMVEFSKLCLETAVSFAPLTPSLSAPVVCVGDANTLQIAYFKIYSRFLDELDLLGKGAIKFLGREYLSVLRYAQYELEFITSNSDLDETLKSKRSIAMETMLYEYNRLNFSHVKHCLNYPLIARDSEGWYVRSTQLMGPLQKGGFSRFNGISFDFDRGSFNILADDASKTGPGLICAEDIATCFADGFSKPAVLFFSLDPPNSKMTAHPFQQWRYSPKTVQNSLILNTMFHTDYLLKQFSTGVEISAKEPFLSRPAREGLLVGLNNFFASKDNGILRSLRERGGFRQSQMRMWIQADEVKFDIQPFENGNGFRILVSDVKMTIRFKIMMSDGDGQTHDVEDDEFALKEGEDGEEDPLRAEKEFCADLTRNYDKLGQVFPEFARLKEIAKMFTSQIILQAQVSHMERLAREFSLSNADYQKHYSEYATRYNVAKRECESQLREAINGIKNLIPSHLRSSTEATDAVYEALRNNFSSLTRSMVSNWLRYGSDSVILDALVTEKMPAFQPPLRSYIEGQNRSHLYEQYNKLVQAAKGMASALSKFNGNSQPSYFAEPWVPAVCQQRPVPGSPGVASIVYGGVVLSPQKISRADMPSYRGHWAELKRLIPPASSMQFTPLPQTQSPVNHQQFSNNSGFKDSKGQMPNFVHVQSIAKSEISQNGIMFEWGGTLTQGDVLDPFYSRFLASDWKHSPGTNYPCVDYINEGTRHVISVKTLNALTDSRMKNPNYVFNVLRKHVNELIDCNYINHQGYELTSDMMKTKELVVGIPANLPESMWVQVRRAADHANDNGIKFSLLTIFD